LSSKPEFAGHVISVLPANENFDHDCGAPRVQSREGWRYCSGCGLVVTDVPMAVGWGVIPLARPPLLLRRKAIMRRVRPVLVEMIRQGYSSRRVQQEARHRGVWVTHNTLSRWAREDGVPTPSRSEWYANIDKCYAPLMSRPEDRQLRSDAGKIRWRDSSYRARLLEALKLHVQQHPFADDGRRQTRCAEGKHRCTLDDTAHERHEFIGTCELPIARPSVGTLEVIQPEFAPPPTRT
jgi:hypothetical protein